METLDLTARYLQEAPLSLLIRLGSSSPSVHGGGTFDPWGSLGSGWGVSSFSHWPRLGPTWWLSYKLQWTLPKQGVTTVLDSKLESPLLMQCFLIRILETDFKHQSNQNSLEGFIFLHWLAIIFINVGNHVLADGNFAIFSYNDIKGQGDNSRLHWRLNYSSLKAVLLFSKSWCPWQINMQLRVNSTLNLRTSYFFYRKAANLTLTQFAFLKDIFFPQSYERYLFYCFSSRQ